MNYEKTTLLRNSKHIPYIVFPALEKLNVVHGFSTRLGGVSTGHLSSMNFSDAQGDTAENILENYIRISKAIGFSYKDLVTTNQTHTTNVKIVTKEDKGKGIVRNRDYKDIDGLITNIPNIPLVSYYADCVPLYIVDPVKKAIGLSHSGWRGTVNHMGKVTVELMKETYGSKPEDMVVCIGPSICKDCYEVSKDVADEFKNAFDQIYWNRLLLEKENGKYQLDLWAANDIIFEQSGIKQENRIITDLCTCCNSDLLFSHRASKGRRGNLAAFLMLK